MINSTIDKLRKSRLHRSANEPGDDRNKLEGERHGVYDDFFGTSQYQHGETVGSSQQSLPAKLPEVRQPTVPIEETQATKNMHALEKQARALGLSLVPTSDLFWLLNEDGLPKSEIAKKFRDAADTIVRHINWSSLEHEEGLFFQAAHNRLLSLANIIEREPKLSEATEQTEKNANVPVQKGS